MVVFDESEDNKSWYDKFFSMIKSLRIKKNDFYQRSIIAFALSVVALFIGLIGGFWFNAAILVITSIAAMEFANMIHSKQQKESKFQDNSDVLYLKKIAIPYILLPALSLIFIRESAQGRSIITWLMLSIASVDTASYLVGNLFGKNKLYPSISPNKTIEGAVGGILAGLVITVILFPIMCIINGSNPTGFSFYSMVFLSLTVSVLSIMGDLFESYIKRQCGVKDSGSILLSHGGVMDRMDSLTFVAPIIAILVIMKKGIFF